MVGRLFHEACEYAFLVPAGLPVANNVFLYISAVKFTISRYEEQTGTREVK
jgi:hypothetical protein